MNTEGAGAPFLSEFKEFVDFLRGLWAILAGISVLFPLSNVLAQVIPVTGGVDGGFAYLSPQLVTGISTVATLFVILWTFGLRRQFAALSRRKSVRRRAAFSFVFGLAALVAYLVGHYAVSTGFYWGALHWESADARRLLGDIILLAAYGGFFLLTTRAFMLLAMIEYLGRRDRRSRAAKPTSD